MKVTPVSKMVTIPADTALCMAASEVSGVAVPPMETLDARFRVVAGPPIRVPVTVSAVHEEVPTVTLGTLPRQRTR